jgi:hypothetical protein
MKPDNIFRTPEQSDAGQSAVLKSTKLMAVISATDEGTQIVLKKLDSMDIEMDN